MGRRVFNLRPFVNKCNKQVSLVLPKTKFKILKKKIPKKIKIEIKSIEW